MTVAVSPLASSMGSARCPMARSMLTNSLSRENGCVAVSERTAMLVLKSAPSIVVNMALQAVHWRRRHVCMSRFCGREFVTTVLVLQYMHTMSIY